MKVSIFSNDKSTMKDELILCAFTLVCLVIGILLMTLTNDSLVVLGVMFIAIVVMFVPCIIYRFMTNNEINKRESKKNE